LELLWIQTLI